MKRWWFEIEQARDGRWVWRVSAEGFDGQSGVIGGGMAPAALDAARRAVALIEAHTTPETT